MGNRGRRRNAGIVIAVHGGAGRRKPRPDRLPCIATALEEGYGVLARGGSALDAVETAIRAMETSGVFNAGAGAVRQKDGRRRMDAGLMEGRRLRIGAVTGVRSARSPVALARAVMEKTPHVLMDGEAARKRFGGSRGRGRPGARKEGSDTVGAVAMDRRGNVAAGTSTGGAPPMLPGRIGDSPLAGCGFYGDNARGAVSATGKGESIIRVSLAADIMSRLGAGQSPSAAARAALRFMRARVGGIAGAIVLDKKGRVAMVHFGWMSGGVRRPGSPALIGVRFQRP